ncbi:hypothetical protein [Actinoplanes palleronii]|uniref:Uncharacterized protein n=1 Tax=Actinoplanes palleronii TaxID=113570 RepID=A0ABQ4BJ72_9ACTN|nr:hypothetical protein [Actinoplanes palleronii]GIE70731.1 hypothetical protein Apa02nite_068390 [Actinoplanes palleronii]
MRRMALLTAVSVTSTATTVAGAAMSTADTIAAADIGVNGALINVINGAGAPVNFTILDPGTTTVGNAGTTSAQAVTNGTDRWFRLSPGHVNPATGFANVTLSSATSVTYKLIRC